MSRDGLTVWVLELSLFGSFLQEGIKSVINAKTYGQQVLMKEDSKGTWDS